MQVTPPQPNTPISLLTISNHSLSPTSSNSTTPRPLRFREELEMSQQRPKPQVTRRDTFDDFVPPERLGTWKDEDEKKAAKNKKGGIGFKFKKGLKGLRKHE